MPVLVNDISYLTASEVTEEVDVTRQTLWRWRQDKKIPIGQRFRNRQVIFSPDEVEIIREYANRIEPITDVGGGQLNLFSSK